MMRVHIKRDRLMEQVKLYVLQTPGLWLKVTGNDSVEVVEVPEGEEGPAFITLPEHLWEAIVKVLPDPEESFVKTTLAREQARIDKLIDHVLKD